MATDAPLGWGDVDDAESIRVIHAAIESGISFMDTADLYGAGHSKKVVAKVDAATLSWPLFGNTFEKETTQCTGNNAL